VGPPCRSSKKHSTPRARSGIMNGGSRRRSVASAEPRRPARAAGRGFCFEQLRGTDAPEERGAYRAPAPFTLAASRGQAAPELEEPRPAFELPPRPGKRPAAPRFASVRDVRAPRRGPRRGSVWRRCCRHLVRSRASAPLRDANAALDWLALPVQCCRSESRRAASRRRQSVQPVHDASIAPLSELLSPQAPASRQRCVLVAAAGLGRRQTDGTVQPTQRCTVSGRGG
jgi:hypothetical protein